MQIKSKVSVIETNKDLQVTKQQNNNPQLNYINNENKSNYNISDQAKINTKNSTASVKTNVDIVDDNKNSFYSKTLNPAKLNKGFDSSKESLFYVNGILTKGDSAEKQTQEISNLVGKPVTLLYNPTEGFVNDVVESALQVMNIKNDKSTVNATSEKFYQTLKSGKELKVVAHSQGAAISAQALTNVEKRLLMETRNPSEVKEMMKKVTVVTMGGAASKADFPSNVNLIERKHKGDIVPKLAENPNVKRPEDLLYKIIDTKDKEVEGILWDAYNKKANDRTFGKLGVALKGAISCSISVACEYVGLKTGLIQEQKTKSGSVADLKIIDVINKDHDALPNTGFNTGYLVNNVDRKAISENLS